MVYFYCVCGLEIEALDGQVGRKVMCPSCRSDLTVPATSIVGRQEMIPDLGIVVPRSMSLLPLKRPKSNGKPNRLAKALEIVRDTINSLALAFMILCVAGYVLSRMAGTMVWIPEQPRRTSFVTASRGFRPVPADDRDVEIDPGDQVSGQMLAEEITERYRDSLRELASLQGKDGRQDFDRSRWFGAGGRVVRLTAREGLPCVSTVPGRRAGWTPRIGETVVLADDGDAKDPSRDVVVASVFAALSEMFKPGLDHREMETAMAADGRLFAVPRGTTGTVIESKIIPWGGDRQLAFSVQFDFGSEPAWVYWGDLR